MERTLMQRLIADEVARRSAGNGDMLLIELSDQRYPELLRQLLKYITQWRGNEDKLIGMLNEDIALEAIAVLQTVLMRQRPALPH